MSKPKGLFAPIVSDRWETDDYSKNKFNQWIEFHSDNDSRDGCTSAYAWDSGTVFRAEEIEGIRETLKELGVEHLSDEGRLNQHCQHAIEQFYAHVQYHYDELVKNLESLHPSKGKGRIDSLREKG